MAQIDIGRVRHRYTREAEQEIRQHDRRGTHLSDEAAATVASWFQTARGHGLSFATLASTGRVDPQDLIDACDYELRFNNGGDIVRKGLIALKQFAQSYQ